MRQMKNHFRLMGKIFMIIGASFLAASIVFIILNSVFVSEYPSALSILASLFGLQGIVWLTIGICFYMYAKHKDMRCERLKRTGMRYAAEIVRIIPRPYVRINGYITVNAECCYTDNNGKRCLVKSDSFMQYGSNEALNANVYVNPGNPRDYFVEINSGVEADIQFDYDYR